MPKYLRAVTGLLALCALPGGIGAQISQRAPREAGAMAPGPAPAGVSVAGSFAVARVSWQPAAGAVTYSVERWLQADPACCRTTSGPLSALQWDDSELQSLTALGNYVYRVSVRYSDSRVGTADVLFNRTAPRDPAGFTAAQTAPRTVQLSWQPVPGVSSYLVGGSGLRGGITVNGTGYTLTNLPLGVQSWTVASAYNPGGILTAAANWPKASVDVAGGSARFRLTLTAADVVHATSDDVLERDGKGDEVVFAAVVEAFDLGLSGTKRVSHTYRRADPVYGDVNGFPNRIMAGSASPRGGIRTGDRIPTGANPGALPGGPMQLQLPLFLHDGALREGRDVLLVHLGVGEVDDVSQASGAGDFVPKECPPDLLLMAPAVQNQLAMPGLQPAIFETVREYNRGVCEASREWQWPAFPVNRAIGLWAGNNDPNGSHFNVDGYFVLTYEKLMAAMGGGMSTVLRMDRVDTLKDGEGHYALYLLAERMP